MERMKPKVPENLVFILVYSIPIISVERHFRKLMNTNNESYENHVLESIHPETVSKAGSIP